MGTSSSSPDRKSLSHGSLSELNSESSRSATYPLKSVAAMGDVIHSGHAVLSTRAITQLFALPDWRRSSLGAHGFGVCSDDVLLHVCRFLSLPELFSIGALSRGFLLLTTTPRSEPMWERRFADESEWNIPLSEYMLERLHEARGSDSNTIAERKLRDATAALLQRARFLSVASYFRDSATRLPHKYRVNAMRNATATTGIIPLPVRRVRKPSTAASPAVGGGAGKPKPPSPPSFEYSGGVSGAIARHTCCWRSACVLRASGRDESEARELLRLYPLQQEFDSVLKENKLATERLEERRMAKRKYIAKTVTFISNTIGFIVLYLTYALVRWYTSFLLNIPYNVGSFLMHAVAALIGHSRCDHAALRCPPAFDRLYVGNATHTAWGIAAANASVSAAGLLETDCTSEWAPVSLTKSCALYRFGDALWWFGTCWVTYWFCVLVVGFMYAGVVGSVLKEMPGLNEEQVDAEYRQMIRALNVQSAQERSAAEAKLDAFYARLPKRSSLRVEYDHSNKPAVAAPAGGAKPSSCVVC